MALEDLSIRISADTASFQAGAEGVESQLGDLSSEAIQTAGALEILSNRADDAGDNISQAGNRATLTAGRFSALSGATTAANASFMGISATTWGSLIPAVVALGAALAPVVGALGGFVAVAGSIAAVGLLPALGGILTHTESLKNELTGLQETITETFGPIFDVAAGALQILIGDFEEMLASLNLSTGTFQQLAADFVNLGRAVIDVIPAFIDLAIALTEEFLPPFVEWLEEFLPQVPGLIQGLVDVFDRMLPKFMEAGRLLGRLLPPLTEFGFTVLNVLGPALADLARIGTDVLQFFNGLDNRVQNAGASLALLLPVITTMASLLGGPLTLALAGVAGAIVGFVKAWETDFANVRTFLTNLWSDVQRVLPAIQGAFRAFREGFDISGVNDALDTLETTLGTQLMNSLEALQPVFSDFVTFLSENESEFKTLGAAASDITIAILNMANGVVNVLVPALRTVMIPALRTAIDVLDWMLEAMTTNIQAFNQLQSGKFGAALETVQSSDAPGEFADIFTPQSMESQRGAVNERIQNQIQVVIEGELPEESIRDVSTSVVNEEQRRTRMNQGRSQTPQ